jgi:hypothetical protein
VADPVDPFGGLEGSDRDAYAAITNTLKAFGLESLAPAVLGYIQQGYSSDTISVILPETPEYKQRFKANDARRAAGLPALSPAEYLSVEDSYRQIMASAGLPPRFYDQADDFTAWIAGDVAPVEVQDRVRVAQEMLYSADPAALEEFRQTYSDGDMIAYALDRDRATQVLSQQWAAAQVRSAGAAQGLAVSVPEAERIGSLGLNQAQLRAGVGQAAAISQSTKNLSTVYGGDYTAQDAVNETFFADANALKKRTRLASQERAAFSGSSGVNQKSLTARKGGQL